MAGFARWYECAVECRAGVNDATGYVIDIKTVDKAVRSHVVPLVEEAAGSGRPPAEVLANAAEALRRALPVSLRALRLSLSPYYSLEMSDAGSILVRQKFDFSAAHRLHSPRLSDEENLRLYGKCNNPRGHGHNYVVEPAVRIGISEAPLFMLAEFESIVDSEIIRPFDHKHLNEDTAEFNVEKGGLLPSVENIARVCFERLSSALSGHRLNPRLLCVTVWETDRTSATYPAPRD